ncbi:hypothetical protein [Planctomycetes bacterium Poly30]|uniref:hypothetical protein n=1 Tax=Saltatorellus ferox TaxID=2528018 RepID=UPI0011A991C9
MTGLSFTSRIGGSKADLRPERPARPVTSPAARSLALAHYIEDAVEKGIYSSAAEVAAALGVTRARVSQIGMLLRLDPSTQERILCGDDTRSARALRPVSAEHSWLEQQGGSVCRAIGSCDDCRAEAPPSGRARRPSIGK